MSDTSDLKKKLQAVYARWITAGTAVEAARRRYRTGVTFREKAYPALVAAEEELYLAALALREFYHSPEFTLFLQD